MTFKKTLEALVLVDIPNRRSKASPATAVLRELGIRGLEEDLYPVEWRDYCFRLLTVKSALLCLIWTVESNG